MKKLYSFVILFILIAFFISCKENEPIPTHTSTSTITPTPTPTPTILINNGTKKPNGEPISMPVCEPLPQEYTSLTRLSPDFQPPATPAMSTIIPFPPDSSAIFFLIDQSESIESCLEQKNVRTSVPIFLISLLAQYLEDKPANLQIGIGAFPSTTETSGFDLFYGLRPISWYSKTLDIDNKIKTVGKPTRYDLLEKDMNQLISQNVEKKILILITDGTFDDKSSESEHEKLEKLVEKLGSENLEVRVLLLSCPNMVKKYSKMKPNQDRRVWDALQGKGLLQLIEGDTVEDYITALVGQDEIFTSFLPDVQKQFLIDFVAVKADDYGIYKPLLDAAGAIPDNPNRGSGWINTQEIASWSTPGDAWKMNIQVISPNSNGGPTLKDTSTDNEFTLVTAEVPGFFNASEHPISISCREGCMTHTWTLKGSTLGFYWWEVIYPSVSIQLEASDPVVNNQPFTVTTTLLGSDVSQSLSEGFGGCYQVRLLVFDEENNLIYQKDRPYEESIVWLVDEYEYLSHGPQDLKIWAQIINTQIISAGRAMTESVPITMNTEYEPNLTRQLFQSTNDIFTTSLYFQYSKPEYYDGQNNDLQVFVLTPMDEPEYNNQDLCDIKPEYKRFKVNEPSGTSLYALEVTEETDARLSEYEGDQFDIYSIYLPQHWVNDCQYQQVIVQWAGKINDWPVVICSLNEQMDMYCRESSEFSVEVK